jgi:RimJ/RimL family protein N-acetyltransferase
MVRYRLPDRCVDGDLVLRLWTVEDAPALHAAVVRNIEHLRPWMPWIDAEPQPLAARVARIAEWRADWAAGGDAALGVFVDGEVAGGVGLHHRVGPHGLTIGYWIDAGHTGRGVCTSAAGLLTTAAFRLPGITHVTINCDEANRASARGAEKLGYRQVGRIAVPVQATAETGRHRVYRMNREVWTAARSVA